MTAPTREQVEALLVHLATLVNGGRHSEIYKQVSHLVESYLASEKSERLLKDEIDRLNARVVHLAFGVYSFKTLCSMKQLSHKEAAMRASDGTTRLVESACSGVYRTMIDEIDWRTSKEDS